MNADFWAGAVSVYLLALAFVVARLYCRDRDQPLRPLPSPHHLSCGECFWLVEAAFPENRSLVPNLIDQLYISPWCELHNGFAHKRWNERHLDDKGLRNPWQTDVDNYRGFLED